MKNKLKRRDFVAHITALTLGSLTLGACFHREKDKSNSTVEGSPGSSSENGLFKNREMPRDLVMKMLAQKADHYMQISNNCAQSSLFSINGTI